MPNTTNTSSSDESPRTARTTLTRQEEPRKLLTRKSGATIAQIQKTFGWQPHTVRAALSARRKAGHVIVHSDGDKGAVYRILKSGTGPTGSTRTSSDVNRVG